jgi:phenylalanyl-tRNA synthetase beta chain
MGIVRADADGMTLSVPTNKVDVTREADVIEEIIRIYGFNNIGFKGQMNVSVQIRQQPDPEFLQNLIAEHLTAKGFAEIMNNSLTRSAYYGEKYEEKKGRHVMLANPLSQDLDMMRENLLFGGLEVIAYNINRRTPDLKVYEFGKVYHLNPKVNVEDVLKNYHEEKHLSILLTGKKEPENWNSTSGEVDFYFMKKTVEGILVKLGLFKGNLNSQASSNSFASHSLQYILNEKVIAEVMEVDPALLRQFDIQQKVFFADLQWEKILAYVPKKERPYVPVSRFPFVRRDLALLVDKTVSFEELKKAALSAERKLLKEVGLFDIYEGEKIPQGKKSYAMSFVLQDEDRTLTDKVIDKTMKKIQSAFERDFSAVLR